MTRRHRLVAAVTAAVLLAAAVAVIGIVRASSDAPSGETDPIAELRREVRALRDSVGAQPIALPASLPDLADADVDLLVGLRTTTLREVLSRAAREYLGEVRLHLRRDVRVTEGDDVRVSVGPVGFTAGRWELAVTIERVDAVLRADSVHLAPGDSGRIAVRVPVRVEEGSGEALIDFAWDAALVTGVVCGDFEVRERFTGVVEPRTVMLEGYLDLVPSEGGVVARPTVTRSIPVSPRPTAAAWSRVRELLAEQDRIFNCGLALSPPQMERRLRRLLSEGFTFDLPSSLLRDLPVPAAIAEEVEVADRRAIVRVQPRAPLLTETWLWLSAAVEADAGG